MSDSTDKIKSSKRRHNDETAIKRQLKIAKEHGLLSDHPANIQPHRYAKHHAMNCGNPKCILCMNPRKTHKNTLTIQEKRNFQDVDQDNDKHSNGLKPTE